MQSGKWTAFTSSTVELLSRSRVYMNCGKFIPRAELLWIKASNRDKKAIFEQKRETAHVNCVSRSKAYISSKTITIVRRKSKACAYSDEITKWCTKKKTSTSNKYKVYEFEWCLHITYILLKYIIYGTIKKNVKNPRLFNKVFTFTNNICIV